MDNKVDREKIAGLMRPYLIEVDGKQFLTCEKAFVLAEAYGLSLSDIGTVCNLETIRISGCQLGCFK